MFFTSSGLKAKRLTRLVIAPLYGCTSSTQVFRFSSLAFCLLLSVWAFTLGVQAYRSSTEALPKCAYQLGTHRLALQIPQTMQQYEDGLMFRRKLAANEGMLFLFAQPQVTHFWMKHCFISMDYVYGAKQQVLAFAENIPPCPAQSKGCPIYSSPQPVTWVLELPAGSVKRLNLQAGMVLKALEAAGGT
jgi:uncharacterized protein